MDHASAAGLEAPAEVMARYQHALRWLAGGAAYDDLNIEYENATPIGVPVNDVLELVRAAVVRVIPAGKARCFGRLFSVVELKKNRRRIIFWPKALNDAIWSFNADAGLEAFPFSLSLPEDHLSDIYMWNVKDLTSLGIFQNVPFLSKSIRDRRRADD